MSSVSANGQPSTRPGAPKSDLGRLIPVPGKHDQALPPPARVAGTVPLGRLGTPEDIAAAVLYLASPAASWVTGQNILVSGGREGGRSVEDR